VWFAHVRVGHRQLPIPKSPRNISCGGFFFVCIPIFWFISTIFNKFPSCWDKRDKDNL